MVYMASEMNITIPIISYSSWTYDSQRSVGQGQQEAKSCQADSPLMHDWFSGRCHALGPPGWDGTWSCSHLYNQIKLFLL